MNYKSLYDSIISRAKIRILPENFYVEKHHIIPRCLGGSDRLYNLVELTPKEHFVCHLLLVKIYPTNVGLIHGAKSLCRKSKYKETNRMPFWLKKLGKGHKLSITTRQKMSEVALARKKKGRKVITPDGEFRSLGEASRFYKITSHAIRHRCNQQLNGFIWG